MNPYFFSLHFILAGSLKDVPFFDWMQARTLAADLADEENQ